MKQAKRINRTGLNAHTITPWTVKGRDGWVLNYTFHGSSFVHAEEFTELQELNRRVAELRGATPYFIA